MRGYYEDDSTLRTVVVVGGRVELVLMVRDMKVWWKLSLLALVHVGFFFLLVNVLFSPDNINNDIHSMATERSISIKQDSGSSREVLNRPSLPHSILLLSSVGRSGSSFLGELLASQGHNMYFYEPIRALNRSMQTEDNIKEELLRYLHCNIRGSMLNIGKRPSINVKHKYVFGKGKKDVCLPKLVELCRQEPLLIIKTIRTRLNWVRDILDNPDVNLKVVHLVRDPRGTHISMDKVDWNIDYREMCDKVLEDLEEKKGLERQYPGQYYFIKYEDFCRDPYRQANQLFRFLQNGRVIAESPTNTSEPLDRDTFYNLLTKYMLLSPGESLNHLPDASIKFLLSHTLVSSKMQQTVWTTARNTLTAYQEWRTKITQNDLTGVEKACIPVIERLGHVFFHSLRRVRNLKISLFD
ncbi:hypothetical protein Pmani_032224 [Petrolisthes manimaculis]|uniref:Sulfotransferase domain-containing protein n=1 Tax=Petrolisthes manimaculis TaxID=1843537 RepID=A0AAE1NTH2_9EUCA|nr:hypothetical protein Pmani_032224 [Petrolisthes manimaculis]